MLLDIESIFPFVRSAQRFTGSYTRMLSKKELIAPFYGYYDYPVFGGFPAKPFFRFYKLHPLNLYVFAEESLSAVKELNRQLHPEGSKIEALIDVVDYAEILRYTTLDEDNLLAKLNVSDFSDSISIVKEVSEIISLWYTKSDDEIRGIVNRLLTESVMGAFVERDKVGLEYHGQGVLTPTVPMNPEAKDVSASTPAISTPTTEAIEQFTEQIRKFKGQELYEAPLPNADSRTSPDIAGGSLDPVETWLREYLLKRSDDARQVATLIGPTAVAKSALVKGLAKELGYRLVDFRCLHGDMEIKLLDGTSKKIKDIPAGEKVWVYSCKKDGGIVPALATALGVTRENASFVEVEVDNGEKVRVTPDHKFILRDGSECEAKDLIPNTSLMPIYSKQGKVRNNKGSLYEMVLDNCVGDYVFTHRLVASLFYDYPRVGYVAHHVNLNSLDNRPENLLVMLDEKHIELHGDIVRRAWGDPVLAAQRRVELGRVLRERWANPEFKKKMQRHLDRLHNSPFRKKRQLDVMSQISKDLWSDPKYRERQIERLHEDWTEERRELQGEKTRQQANFQWLDPLYREKRRNSFILVTKKIVEDVVKEILSKGEVVDKVSYEKYRKGYNFGKPKHSRAPEYRFMRRRGLSVEGVVSDIKNHKVVSVKVVDGTSNAYCLNVPEYHNFALSSGIFVKNCAFVERSDMEGMKKFAIDSDTQRMMSYSASMDKMIMATDDFQKFASQKYDQIEKYLTDTTDIPKDEKDTIESLQKKFAEWKKPVLLFFDEINRAPKSVIATLTAILNQKVYNNHSMEKCRMVCAANAPIGLDPSVHDIYTTTMIDDPAAVQRFESIPVNPKDVYGRWKKYIQSAGWHKSVVDFVDTPEKAYSIDVLADIYKKYGDGQETRAALDPFPHYRSWEFVSNHVNAVEAKKDFFNPVFITNLIGENAVSEEYLKYLMSNYKSIVKHVDDSPDKEQDEFTKGIMNCVGSGNAMMMIAPTGYGKCVVGSSLIRLENKIVKIEGLDKPEFLDDCFNNFDSCVMSTQGVDKAAYFYKSKGKTIKISDSEGCSVEGTYEHPVLCLKDTKLVWKPLDSVKVGDCVAKFNGSEDCVGFDAEYYLVGYAIGDGSWNKDRVTITCHGDFLERLISILEGLGYSKDDSVMKRADNFKGGLLKGKKVFRCYEDKRNSVYNVVIYYFRLHGLLSKTGLPDGLTVNEYYNILAGIADSAGHFNMVTGVFEVTFKNESLSRSVLNIFSCLGYKTGISKKLNKVYLRYYYRTYLGVSSSLRFFKLISPLLRIKNFDKVLNGVFVSGNRNEYFESCVPNDIDIRSIVCDLYHKAVKKCGASETYFRELTSFNIEHLYCKKSIPISMVVRFAEEQGILVPDEVKTLSKYRFSLVTSVEKGDVEKKVFDLSVPVSHSFVSNGFYVHNTSRVNKVCKKMALDPPFIINMSQKDRVDVMGAPKTINTIDYVLEDLKGKLPETHPLYAQLKDPAVLGQLGLPEEVTVFAPDIEFTKRIRKLKKGQKLVVFFDELNRAQQTAMSSVFEAISDCLHPDTLVRLLDDSTPTIKEVCDRVQSGEEVWMMTCSSKGDLIPSRIIHGNIGRKNAEFVSVVLDSGDSFRCTADHKVMLANGEYCEAKDLVGKSCGMNHQVVAVTKYDGVCDAYDLTLENNPNILLACGVFVHNSRLFGVQFEPGQVVVVQAMNFGERYEGAKAIDSAFSGRNAMYTKFEYDVKDVEDYLTGIKSEGYSSVILDYLASKNSDELIQMFMHIEDKDADDVGFGHGAPTFRGWSTLNKSITHMDNISFCGAVLDYDGSVESRMIQLLPRDMSGLTDRVKFLLDLVPKNWAGYDPTIDPVEYDGVKYSVKDFVQSIYDTLDAAVKGDYKDAVSLGNTLSSCFSKLLSIDNQVKIFRTKGIISILGEKYGPEFITFFNESMGRSSLELSDVIDEVTATKYIRKLFFLQTDQLKLVDKIATDAVAHAEIFKTNNSVQQNFFRGIIDVVIDERHTSDFFMRLVTSAESNNDFYEWFNRLFLDSSFAAYVMVKFGIKEPEMVDAVLNYNKQKSGRGK